MRSEELMDMIKLGETSRVQFKLRFDNQDKIAADMIAFANSKGGILLFGVNDKNGEVIGLDYKNIQITGNKVSTFANELIKPQLQILTEVVNLISESGKKHILVITIEEGFAKPYKDLNGICWVKRGSDKRRVTDNFELLRLFQQSGMLHIDEMKIPNTSKKDIDETLVAGYIRKIWKKAEDEDIQLNDTLFENLNIINNNNVTLGGLLFFGKNPQRYRPAFCTKAISFFGNSIGGLEYRDSKDINGTIPEMFSDGIRFFTGNLRHVQAGQNFNSTGILEISLVALEEILQNALIHRDYTKNHSEKDVKSGVYEKNRASSSEKLATSHEGVTFLAGNANDNLASSGKNLDSPVKYLASLDGNLATIPDNQTPYLISKKRIFRNKIMKSIIELSQEYITIVEMADKLKKNKRYLKNEIIPQMVRESMLERLYPHTPNHPKQKYRAVNS